jgi:hypothetical protein
MQYLKDEVRNSIAEEALKEFMEKGPNPANPSKPGEITG